MASNFTNWFYGSDDSQPENTPAQSDTVEINFDDSDQTSIQTDTQTSTAADAAPGSIPPPLPCDGPDQTKQEPPVAQISMQLDDLFAKVEEFQRIIVSQNRMIERYNDDIVGKMQTPLLLQIIQYVDSIQNMLHNADEREDRCEDAEIRYRELKNEIETFQRLILADLENYNIHQFQDTLDTPLAFSKRQEVIDRETSGNENEFVRYGEGVTTFYRTELPGYFMLMPDKEGKNGGLPTENILRREQVIKIVYSEK